MGIIKADGTPGSNYAKAIQREGFNPTDQYTVKPSIGSAYPSLPQPLQIGILTPSFQFLGATPDTRFPADLANGSFQITKYVPYGSACSATGDPVHRFFQMWQQIGGNNRDLSLFTWVATTVGTGGNNGPDSPTPANTQQGGELMGFFNMAQGDAPIFNQLAKAYPLSDNYHQSILGGTGANFFALATADEAVFNQNGILGIPPANQIENPDPQAGTENFYTQDGYAGGSYVNCSDASQPGVASILNILKEKKRASRCEKNTYYLVNNYDTPYKVDGTAKALGADKFVYPPQTVPIIGEALSAKAVSWKWYTAGRDQAGVLNDPLNGSSNVVNKPALREHFKGMDTFKNDIVNGTLPAVSFVVPKNLSSGHPGYSAPVAYEMFIKELISSVQSKPELWADTAIIITTDEVGGYFDAGSIQNVDFFGDGPRIPLLVVSPFAKKGYVDHVYHDHASILKFIEYNWSLLPLSKRSRDNLPNPKQDNSSYLPTNQSAIGDLRTLFNFKS